MPRKTPIDRRESQTQTAPRDLAASHARTLLHSCGLQVEVPDRACPLSSAAEWARSGAMELTGPAAGRPRFPAGPLATAAKGVGMVLRALAPESPLADLDTPALLGERAAIADLKRNGAVSAGGSAHLISTRASHLVVNLPREQDWQLIPAWLEVKPSQLATTRDWSALAKLVAEREAEELVERGRLMGLAIAPVPKAIPCDRPLFALDHETQASSAPRTRPLRLLDLSSLWAGPLATSLLAMAGVEVLKIESPTRPDGARQGPNEFFQLLNGNKQGCALDLHQPRERALFETLLENADIVVESARSRALEQLGIEAANWVEARGGRLWASITGYGRSRQWIGFGDDAAVAAGLAWSPDLADVDPVFCGDAIADPLTGMTLAALLLGLNKSGRGGLVDLSLSDCVADAARLGPDELIHPLHAGPDGWQVDSGRECAPVKMPRSRDFAGNPPNLARPDAALLDHWTKPC